MLKTTVVNKRKHAFDVYIGRGGKFNYYGNPYKIGVDGTREEVITKYRNYFYKQIDTNIIFKRKIQSLKGKRLGCFCVDEPIDHIREDKHCHGEIILEYLENKKTLNN